MTNVPVPSAIAKKIADRATQLAREDMQKRGWRSANAINPVYGDGKVGLSTTLKYLMIQEKGMEGRVMHEVEGKVVKMKDGQFRTAKGVGQPGWVTLPGGVRKYRDQKWRHPGIKEQGFMRKAIEQAIKEYQPQINNMCLQVLMGKQ